MLVVSVRASELNICILALSLKEFSILDVSSCLHLLRRNTSRSAAGANVAAQGRLQSVSVVFFQLLQPVCFSVQSNKNHLLQCVVFSVFSKLYERGKEQKQQSNKVPKYIFAGICILPQYSFFSQLLTFTLPELFFLLFTRLISTHQCTSGATDAAKRNSVKKKRKTQRDGNRQRGRLVCGEKTRG